MSVDIFVLVPCATAQAFHLKLKDKKINLEKAICILEGKYEFLAKTPGMIILSIDNKAVTLSIDSIRFRDIDLETCYAYANKIFEILYEGGALI